MSFWKLFLAKLGGGGLLKNLLFDKLTDTSLGNLFSKMAVDDNAL